MGGSGMCMGFQVTSQLVFCVSHAGLATVGVRCLTLIVPLSLTQAAPCSGTTAATATATCTSMCAACACADPRAALHLSPLVAWCLSRCRGRYDAAIENYSKAIELDAKNASAYNNRGYAWRKLGRFDKAVAGKRKAQSGVCCELGATSHMSSGVRGGLLLPTDYTKSLELDPNNVRTLNNRGYSYAKSGMYDAAIADYTKVAWCGVAFVCLLEHGAPLCSQCCDDATKPR